MLSIVERSLSLGPLLLSLWFIWCAVGGTILVITIPKIMKSARPREVIAEPDIDTMSGEAFEAYLANIFTCLGYRVSRTRATGDYGADLILERDQHRIVVQAKRYAGTVSNKAIQEVVAAKPMYKCTQALVVTNSYFTKPAQILAAGNNVELWDRTKLIRVIADVQAQRTNKQHDSRRSHGLMNLVSLSVGAVLLSCGLVGFVNQKSLDLGIGMLSQPITNSILLGDQTQPQAASGVGDTSPTSNMTTTQGISTSKDTCGTAIVRVVAALAIRQAPSLQSDKVGEVPRARSVTLICEPTVLADGVTWQLVDYGVGRGWMSRKYLYVMDQ